MLHVPNEIKHLYDHIYFLKFSTYHKKTFTAPNVDPFGLDVLKRTKCNDLFVDEFNSLLQEKSKEIIKTASDNDKQRGYEYKNDLLNLIVNIELIKNNLFDGSRYIGKYEEVKESDLFEAEEYTLGVIEYRSITSENSKDEFYKMIFDTLYSLRNDLTRILFPPVDSTEIISDKLEWNATPAIFAALLLELETQGWINPPLTDGDISYLKLSKLCDKIFKFNGTQNSLYQALKNKNSLSQIKKDKISLPKYKSIQ